MVDLGIDEAVALNEKVDALKPRTETPVRATCAGRAKFEIYQLIAELAKKEKGIIIISSEMPELLGITDRILVMSNGLVAGIVDTKTTTQNEILRLASLHL